MLELDVECAAVVAALFLGAICCSESLFCCRTGKFSGRSVYRGGGIGSLLVYGMQ